MPSAPTDLGGKAPSSATFAPYSEGRQQTNGEESRDPADAKEEEGKKRGILGAGAGGRPASGQGRTKTGRNHQDREAFAAEVRHCTIREKETRRTR